MLKLKTIHSQNWKQLLLYPYNSALKGARCRVEQSGPYTGHKRALIWRSWELNNYKVSAHNDAIKKNQLELSQ